MTHLDAATDAAARILVDITALVEVETSSYDKAALDNGIGHVERLLTGRLGEADESRSHDGGSLGDVLTATYRGTGAGHVALVAHYDTVWPTGAPGPSGMPRRYQARKNRTQTTQMTAASGIVYDASVPMPADFRQRCTNPRAMTK